MAVRRARDGDGGGGGCVWRMAGQPPDLAAGKRSLDDAGCFSGYCCNGYRVSDPLNLGYREYSICPGKDSRLQNQIRRNSRPVSRPPSAARRRLSRPCSARPCSARPCSGSVHLPRFPVDVPLLGAPVDVAAPLLRARRVGGRHGGTAPLVRAGRAGGHRGGAAPLPGRTACTLEPGTGAPLNCCHRFNLVR
ncbi:hypothetical protein EJB05_49405, partial [Eragrostis curvula]